MKNKLYYLGLICCILVLAGALFKMHHLPEAGIALTLSVTIFCLWFIPLSLISSYKAENGKEVTWLYIVSFICIIVDLGGSLFPIQHWPGAEWAILIGLPATFTLFLPVYLLYTRKNGRVNYRNLMPVMFFFAYYAVITAMLSLNVSRNVIDTSVVAAYKLEEMSQLTNLQSSLIDFNSKDSAIAINVREETDKLSRMIDSLKKEIAVTTGGNHEWRGSTDRVNLWQIKAKDINTVGTYWFVYSENGKLLKKEIKKYRNFLLSALKNEESEVAGYINYLLNTESKNEQNWEESKFAGKNLINTITTLELIKRDISLAELEAISAISESI